MLRQGCIAAVPVESDIADAIHVIHDGVWALATLVHSALRDISQWWTMPIRGCWPASSFSSHTAFRQRKSEPPTKNADTRYRGDR